jgi:hypothetical protein
MFRYHWFRDHTAQRQATQLRIRPRGVAEGRTEESYAHVKLIPKLDIDS